MSRAFGSVSHLRMALKSALVSLPMLLHAAAFYLCTIYAYLLFDTLGHFSFPVTLFNADAGPDDNAAVTLQTQSAVRAAIWCLPLEPVNGTSPTPSLLLPVDLPSSTGQCVSASPTDHTTSTSTSMSMSTSMLGFCPSTLVLHGELSPKFYPPPYTSRIGFTVRSLGRSPYQRVAPLCSFLPLPITLMQAYVPEDISLLVRTIKLYLQRFCCLRHEFLRKVLLLHECEPCQPLNVVGVLADALLAIPLVRTLDGGLSYLIACWIKRPAADITRGEFMGGGAPAIHTRKLKGSFLAEYSLLDHNTYGYHDTDFCYFKYATMEEATILCEQDASLHPFCLPVYHLTKWLTRDELRRMASLHNIPFDSRDRKLALAALFLNHNCEVCNLNVSLFRCPVSAEHEAVNEEPILTGLHKAPSPKALSRSLLKPYGILPPSQNETEETYLRFAHYLPLKDAMTLIKDNHKMEAFTLPMKHLAHCLTRDELRRMASLHNIHYRQKDRKPVLKDLFTKHQCDVCEQYASIFENCGAKKGLPTATEGVKTVHISEHEPDNRFPPAPPSRQLVEQIVNDFCADTSPSTFEESGCAVCGQLTPYSELIPVANCGCDLSPLVAPGVTRRERSSQSVPIQELEGPVIDRTCKNICLNCVQSLEKGKVPKHALANGLWLGVVPDELKGLTFAEKMMIARVRHNRAVVRVSSGRAKMVANVIMFSNPTLAVYRMLPPSRDEMKEVLACIFTGSAQPTEEDFKRTPFLVRRDKVSNALDWLKLNHSDYQDLEISDENLKSYPLSGVPVHVDFKKTRPEESNKLPAAMSSHDMEEEDGTEEGICPFAVHGITGEEYTKLSMTQLKARALKHLHDQGKVLGIGHEDKPQSIYDNPQAYPQMFPWLFPYGYGGIGQARHKKKMSEAEHKNHLLMYHDKRFQTDLYFPIVAFNHEQLKAGITGSFLLAKRKKFNQISQRLTALDQTVLSGLVKRLSEGERVCPETDAEKACFTVLEDLDHVGGHVKGSLTSKKYMRHELWSLISFLGAPSWFITLSPADNRHPICLYFADTGERFSPELRLSAERNLLIANNPVAAARFFDLMVRSFIKNVLGVDHDHPGLYGKTSGYYGTVEQQGRLTLHLHLLLWIAGALSPQDIRDRLVSNDSVFQQELTQYLESVHQGEFTTGSMDSVCESVPMQPESRGGIHAVLKAQPTPCPSVSNYKDPTLTLPIPAPLRCNNTSDCECDSCKRNDGWWSDYRKSVDDLLLRSNVHRCTTSSAARQSQPPASGAIKTAKQGPKGCLDRDGICRARFPRDIHDTTTVDKTDGHIKMKKLEAYMNTFTPCLTYLMRCNTDVTSLSSGTSIKAIVSYISDYVTKPALKTHQIFSSMYDVFERNKVQLGDSVKTENDASRRLILKIVNSLNAKMEIGSPMASMYLLGNPDHYTGHQFVCFWWKSYVTYLQQSSTMSSTPDSKNVVTGPEEIDNDCVRVGHEEGVYIASTNIDDYRYRPDVYSDITLYEWTQVSHKRRANKKELEKMQRPLPAKVGKASYHQFKDGHPMRATHVVKCNFDRLKTVVPNLVGGALPRHDAGNREYYCCTMLTLFFPWREASCIKKASMTWEAAFDAYEFTTRHQQLMCNFNLRYECLDARDDFHAQLKKKQLQTRTPWHNTSDSDVESDTDFVRIPPTGRIDHGVHGKAYTTSLRMMNSISAILAKAGWLDQCSEVPGNAYVRLCPEQIPGSSWSNIVKNRCMAIFRLKFASYVPPMDIDDSPGGNIKPVRLVRVLHAEYFRKDFRAKEIETNRLIDDTILLFSLNNAQERAFRIITNHSSEPATEQLKMYLGGMGGTGKSQVIKALIHFYGQRKEDHRFLVLAPTGSAAALLNGFTYHKALGIFRKNDVGQDFSRNESAILNDVRARLQGVEYIFIDEISMIACHELYAISARLAQITGRHDVPFGGINIVLAGDFGQLPPVFGSPLFDGLVERYVNSRMSVRSQETVIGKVLWHQITTVVILVENMRQKTQTEADGKLRTALENMRYASCTPEDIAFLRTLIPGRCKTSPCLSDPRFRNVSIITARNNQRDRINEEGSRRFAEDHNLDLTHFYSLDELAGGDSRKTKHRKRKRGIKKTDALKEPTLSGLTRADQEALWECDPHMSDHIPAKLSLCVGMPVMIRHNEATELCITKGQEAVVVGWDAIVGPYGRQVLETLFVQLLQPPKDVQLADLPMNVVPLTKLTNSVQCKARSDQLLQIKRQQVPVLLNFAMTDYASQGKTRLNNVVDLGYCRDHQSYYTALSRSSSAAGTALIQDFSDVKITRGISGWLRQEFRELNVLDEITRLRYENCLSDGVAGPLRNPMVRAYYIWIEDTTDDDSWHSAIRYKPWETRIKPVEQDATWDSAMFKALRKFNKVGDSLKRGPCNGDVAETPDPAIKIPRTEPAPEPFVARGLIWNSKDYSCAYDSLFTVLYNIWIDAPQLWSERYQNLSELLKTLTEGFNLVQTKSITMEAARDAVRLQLNLFNGTQFPMGTTYTCLSSLTDIMMTNRENRISGKTGLRCDACGFTSDLLQISECFQLKDTGPLQDGRHERGHIADCLGWHLSDDQRKGLLPCTRCPSSSGNLRRLDFSMTRLPYIMCIMLNTDRFIINTSLTYFTDMFDAIFKLRGIIYGDGDHFVARVFTSDGHIWYHDGMTTRSGCIAEGHLDQVPDTEWLMTCSRGYSCRKAVLAVYGRD